MRKRTLILIAIFVACMVLSLLYTQTYNSNRNIQNEIRIDLNTADKLAKSNTNSYGRAPEKYKIERYLFRRPHIKTRTGAPRHFAIGEQTAYGDTIYYKIVHDIPMGIFADAVDIYVLDRISGDVQLIYQTDDSFGIGYLNEFRCNDRFLFWVQFNDRGWKICKMDLASREPVVIRAGKPFPDSIPPSLSVSNEYVSWFEKDGEKNILNLVVYSIDKEQPIILSSSPEANIPCERAHIRDNTLAYWSEDASGVTIHVCNLETLNTQTLLLPRDARVENVYSNGKITAWFENFYSSSILIYDHAKHTLYSTEEYVFSMDIVDRTVFINTGNSIIAYDLEDHSRHVLIEPKAQQRYIMATVTSDNKFIAYNDQPDGLVETIIVER